LAVARSDEPSSGGSCRCTGGGVGCRTTGGGGGVGRRPTEGGGGGGGVVEPRKSIVNRCLSGRCYGMVMALMMMRGYVGTSAREIETERR
jgi:hypothetical protein